MKRTLFVVLSVFGICITCKCQKAKTYNWSWDKDGAVLASSLAGFAGTQYMINSVGQPTNADIRVLDYNSVWGFDRGAIFNNSEGAASMSDMFLFSSFALPYISILDKDARGERGTILGMMFETLLINTNITNAFKASTKRLRPYAYRVGLGEDLSISSKTRQSFISGHTSNVAAASFFTAKVISDMNPNSKWKPLVWASAFMIPATTGYLRYKAGRHFPSDVVVGYGVGALIGYFVPHFHKVNRNKAFKLGVLPVGGGVGLSLDVNLNENKDAEHSYIEF